jgi:hypothetical protein
VSLFGKKASLNAEPSPGPVDPPPVSSAKASRGYGIDDVIHLMRKLPTHENVELVLLVVRNTLESMNVDLKDVIDDGTSKQARLRTSIASLDAAIGDLEKEIEARRQEKAAIELDLGETTTVKEQLEIAFQRESTIRQPIALTPVPKPPPPPHRGSKRPSSSRTPRKKAEGFSSSEDPMVEVDPESDPTPPTPSP